jgi:hypothetical protein
MGRRAYREPLGVPWFYKGQTPPSLGKALQIAHGRRGAQLSRPAEEQVRLALNVGELVVAELVQ